MNSVLLRRVINFTLGSHKLYSAESKTLHHGSRIHHAGDERPAQRGADLALPPHRPQRTDRDGGNARIDDPRDDLQRSRGRGCAEACGDLSGEDDGQRLLRSHRGHWHLLAHPWAEEGEGTRAGRRQRDAAQCVEPPVHGRQLQAGHGTGSTDAVDGATPALGAGREPAEAEV